MLISFIKKNQSIIWALIAISLATFIFSDYLKTKQVDPNIISSANIFFCIITLLSIFMQMKALKHKNPNVFIRSVMGGLFLKMMLTAFAVVIYFVVIGKNFITRGVFVSLFLYLIYLGLEVATMMSLNKRNNG
jgi:RsiW-degrading membrane proteinase PrsW (M82 family)